MSNDANNLADIDEVLDELQNVHYSSGLTHQSFHRSKAMRCMESDELQAIYHLVESHTPALRYKTVLRYEKFFSAYQDDSTDCILPLHKNFVTLNCSKENIENVNRLLDKIQKLPSEWTLIQVTPHLNVDENVVLDLNKYYTNALYMSVFNCGRKVAPFCISVDKPFDAIDGSCVELMKEMHSIIFDNKEVLSVSKKIFSNRREKQDFQSNRQSIDDRLKQLVNDVQNLWLKEWRCLFIGKYVDDHIECEIHNEIRKFLEIETPNVSIEKTEQLLYYITKGVSYLKISELKRIVNFCLPQLDLKKVVHFVRNLSENLSLSNAKRHPVILIIEDTLDSIPWEMIDVLQNQPVSRLPSLHLAYALFKKHEDKIKNGHKIITNYRNGTYIVNPDLDLTLMENRIMSFYKYWLSDWKGLSGQKPTEKEFENLLLSGDIFSYSGHGSGTQFFSMEKIQRICINAVVLLFGCGSTRLNKTGPQVEMFGAYQMYLVACSPCVVGMLWEVTDYETDLLTTEFLSEWIPSKGKISWGSIDKEKWKRGAEFDNFAKNIPTINKNKKSSKKNETELLRALSSSKNSRVLNYYLTKAACVARGIPIKIDL